MTPRQADCCQVNCERLLPAELNGSKGSNIAISDIAESSRAYEATATASQRWTQRS